MDRYLLIDPINLGLVAFPESLPQLPSGNSISSSVSANGSAIVGSTEPRFNFETTFLLNETEAGNLSALARYQATVGRSEEIVVYYLLEKVYDKGAQTREGVPGLTPDITGFGVSYYPAIQGFITVALDLVGNNDGPRYRATFNFTEGTIRRP